jgi:hypothetical protein
MTTILLGDGDALSGAALVVSNKGQSGGLNPRFPGAGLSDRNQIS